MEEVYGTNGTIVGVLILLGVLIVAWLIGQVVKRGVPAAVMAFVLYIGAQALAVRSLGIKDGHDGAYFYLIMLAGMILVPVVAVISGSVARNKAARAVPGR